MIANALFLCAALAPTPAMAFTPGLTDGPVRAYRAIVSSADFIRYATRARDHRILIVGGNPDWVFTLRLREHKAFGALTGGSWPGVTPWHAAADAGEMPFKDGTFHTIYWKDESINFHASSVTPRDSTMAWLRDVIRLIEPKGFLLFVEGDYPLWGPALTYGGWFRLPMVLDDMSVYQRQGLRAIGGSA